MLKVVIKVTQKRLLEWKQDYAQTNKDMVLNRELSTLKMDTMIATVFGAKNTGRIVTLILDGQKLDLPIGYALRKVFLGELYRAIRPIRLLLIPLLDTSYVGAAEKELESNSIVIR